jgi:diguanylate cyclase (GGDEF)-like protein/PAS domain S-box-containing protein
VLSILDRPRGAARNRSGGDPTLNVYRFLCAAVAVLMVASGFIVQSASPTKIDPLEFRAVAAAAILSVIILSYTFCRYSRGVEAALQESEESYRTLFESQSEGIALIDRVGRFVLANPAAHAILGVDRGALVGRRIDEFRAERDAAPDSLDSSRVEPGTDLRRDDVGQADVYELEIAQPAGDRRGLLVTATPRRDGNGRHTGSFLVLRDITEQRRAESKLRYLGFHDALTGLYNRAYLNEEMSRLDGGRSYPVTVVMVDVDGLKLVNDRLGHAAGDELLVGCAGVLTASLRQGDVIARVGGDEFAVILPRTDGRAAESVCHRIEQHVAVYQAEHPTLPLSLSHGHFTVLAADTSLELAFELADQAMYLQKRSRKASRDDRSTPVLVSSLAKRGPASRQWATNVFASQR